MDAEIRVMFPKPRDAKDFWQPPEAMKTEGNSPSQSLQRGHGPASF